MKKIISLALSAALVLSMSIAAFAASSIVGGTIGSVSDADLAAAGITGSAAANLTVTDMDANSWSQINSNAELEKISSTFSGKTIVNLGAYDINGSAGWFEVYPTYSANIVVLHLVNGAWVELETANLNGTTVAYSSGFSPIAVFNVSAATTTTPSTTTTTTTTVTSPVTGEVNTVAIALSAMAVVSVVAYGVSRKKEEN